MNNQFQTPLAKVRGHGAAHTGTEHFRHQRLTAIANVPLMGFVVWIVLVLAGKNYWEVAECLATPWVATTLILAMASMFYHMKLGMQVVIEDYMHNKIGRILLIANTFFCIVMFVIGTMAVIQNMVAT